ncbi:MAG: hypothetical protein A2107_12445 [Verrucomicrobia bacterium GWF2_62_7]|nr:MAG: hypothetical protein A2107_12445 [Verrucomicrobia bacterium GWF2_62_7]
MKLTDLAKSGKPLLTAEIFPPKGTNLARVLAKAKLLSPAIAAFNITDSQRAVMRLSALAISKVLRDAGYLPIYQLTCRDRNRIALQSDLLGAAALGIENVLLLSGDHPKHGDHPEAKPVFDLDAAHLLDVARGLMAGKDMQGNALDGRPDFCLGAVVNPTAEPMEHQLFMLRKKVMLGAEYFQTQVIYDVAVYRQFLAGVAALKLPAMPLVLPSVLLLKSAKMAERMAQVPGIRIPESVVARMQGAADPLAEGQKICAELIDELLGLAPGAHIMAINCEELIPDILARCKKL